MQPTDMIIAVVVAIIGSSGIWTVVNGIITRRKERKSTERDALLGLLHVRIYEDCRQILSKGYMTMDDYENIQFLYKPYRELGGNGTCEKLYEEVNDLGITTEKGECYE